jgi:hypothetical protein
MQDALCAAMCAPAPSQMAKGKPVALEALRNDPKFLWSVVDILCKRPSLAASFRLAGPRLLQISSLLVGRGDKVSNYECCSWLAGIFTSDVLLLQYGEIIWERIGGSPPDKNWAADYRKGTCIGYKILRTSTEDHENAEGTRATQPSVEGSPERVHNGFSRSENLSGQLIAIEHSHRTHMIEISCESPCCVPKDTKNIRMVDESETWRRMVSRCSEICITSNRS